MKKRFEVIATCFDKKGRVLSSARNSYEKSHPLFKRYAILAGESEEKIYQHAEAGALLKAKGQAYSILVQRFDAFGRGANAKPCKTCQLLIKDFGVKIVRYTTEEGIQEYRN